MLFKTLTPEETPSFLAYAHDEWTPATVPSSVWHPAVRKEWYSMDLLAATIRVIYEGCAPDINAAPSNVTVDFAAETVYDCFTTHATAKEIELWHSFPYEVRNRIVRQVVGEYY